MDASTKVFPLKGGSYTREEKLIADIEKAIEKRRCVPVIGAGASISAGGPSWMEYLEQMATGLPEDVVEMVRHSSADPLEIATSINIERKRMRLAPVDIQFPGFSRIHKALASWHCPLYLTTNFDRGLERAIEADDESYKTFTNDQLEHFNLLSLPDYPVIVKLCSSSRPRGRMEHSDALTREDFARLLHRDRAALELLVTVLRCATVVFVGCSMRDPLITAALDQSYASGIGYGRHVAFLSTRASTAQIQTLAEFDVDTLSFEINGEPSLLTRVNRFVTRSCGDYKLLVFEPFRSTKVRQILEAIGPISQGDKFARIGFITSNQRLAQQIPAISRELVPNIAVDTIKVTDISNADEIVEAARRHVTSWSALFAPFEYTVEYAANFANVWNSVAPKSLSFHSLGAATISRDKRKFRSFLDERFKNHKTIQPTPFKLIKVSPDMTAEALLGELRKTSWPSTQIVVKPPNASGSIGVRPIDLEQSVSGKAMLNDFLNILRSMPVETETMRCDVAEVIAEQRHPGEEFSVESRLARDSVETLAIHWKIDIDRDDTRFFERLFVTLPHGEGEYQILDSANNELLRAMQVGDGVFHAEYRFDVENGCAYPLEVGLRPGGGMVSSSVHHARGVDLFEAAIRCAIQAPENRPGKRRIVATGLVFAKGSGVLPPLRVTDNGKSWTVVMEDKRSLHEFLRRRTSTVNRNEAKELLKRLLSRDSRLCQRTLDAFDPNANGGIGLRASIESVDVWLPPGSVVTEEEASYISGLLAVADSGLSSDEAVAEAVAAVELCLTSIVCVPEPALTAFTWHSSRLGLYPQWWTVCTNRVFRSAIDSWTYSRALARAVEMKFPGRPSIMDLGCGSARPAIFAIKEGMEYFGLDIDPEALADARGNIARLGGASKALTFEGDVLHKSWIDRSLELRSEWDIVAANLPYLPAPANRLNKDVDGGNEGLRYIPGRVLEIANQVNATTVVINVSSLCNLPEFSRRVAEAGYGVVRVIATLAPLEEYALQVFDYLQRQSFVKCYGVGARERLRQIIYGIELERRRGISMELMMSQVNTLLRPDVNEIGTMVIGTSNW